MDKKTIKAEIKKSYGNIAKGYAQADCCSADSPCCSTDSENISMTEDYSKIEGYQKDADLSLGCGIPTEIAKIKEGDTVVDLGSGAGNDVFIARSIVGVTGKVIGVDMTPEMVIRARQNNQKLGYNNVEFVLGEIENMASVSTNTVDVVISNCVMNLVEDKEKAFNEIHRILKEEGHFSISDIVYKGYIPGILLEAAEMYVGCIAGASEKNTYLKLIEKVGFKNVQVKRERLIDLPDDLLLEHISEKEFAEYKKSNSGIYSITLYADKLNKESCCDTTESECCGRVIEASGNDGKSACCTANSSK